MPTQGPIPIYRSPRLIGIELEFDASNAKFKLPPALPAGWSNHGDGSLHNGREIVLEPPERHPDAVPKIVALNEALDSVSTYVGRKGGFHVHVQISDYTLHDCVRLANLYRHFQPVINMMVAKSRVGNVYCPAYQAEQTAQSLSQMFGLDMPAMNRQSARCTRQYSVVNFAMFRCSTPGDRTVEFRQGSTSKRADCVAGWSAFCTALVDIAKHEGICNQAMGFRATLAGLRRAMALAEELTGNLQLADWVQWRHDYLNEGPSDQLITAAVQRIGSRWHGMFFVSRELNINNALAQRILEKAHQKGLLEKNGMKYRAPYLAQGGGDLDDLVSAMAAIEATASAPSPA